MLKTKATARGKIRKIVLLVGIGCAVILGSATDAKALTIGDSHQIGAVRGNVAPGEGLRRNLVNHLIDMALATHDKAFGRELFRSSNSFGQLQDAVLSGHVSGTAAIINLGSGLYTYLFANYDGARSDSAQVWYVGNLSGIITIPEIFGQKRLSGWTLFGPGAAGAVPDGGATVMLLGGALALLGVLQRRLKA